MENLQNLLRLERVILSNKISKGIYEKGMNRVRMVSTVGKWIIGYYEGNVNYLRPYEALHLMEMCKLEVTFEAVPMSIEQAYAIFLDESNDETFEEYLVYSYLSRAGYLVYIHNPQIDREKFEAAAARVSNKEDEMVWCVLKEKLNLPVSADFIKLEHELYESTKTTMNTFCEQISGERTENVGESSQAENEPPIKRHKPEPEEPVIRNFIDILKTEVEYYTYEHIFNKFSYIKRAETFAAPDREWKLKFDIFLPNTNFKRTEDLPNYRIVIVK
jgi:tRNA-splicing endonuclease subunit Sen54